jgi:cell division septal protein FtsQ
MTERNQRPEQPVTRSYNHLKKIYDPRRDASVRGADRYEAMASQSLQRAVMVPDEDPSTAWRTFDQRQKQLRHVRGRPRPPEKMVSRTFVQTGVRASSGRIQAARRPLPYKSSIPQRSGRRRLRRGFFWRLLGLFTIIACAVALTNFLLTGPMFRVQQVDVIGTKNAALLQSINQMHVKGQNIFLLNTGSMQARIKASPLVASVVLSKEFPDHLIITIAERKPVALWQTAQGIFSVDAHGVVIATASNTPEAADLGIVVDMTQQSEQGQHLPKTEPLLHPGTYLKNVDTVFANEVWQQVPKVVGISTFGLYYDGTMYASTISQTGGSVDSRGSYIIESPAGWKAYLGGSQDPNSLDNRLKELKAILQLANRKQENIAIIDLRYGLRPVYTLK